MIERERKFLPDPEEPQLRSILANPEIERREISQGYVLYCATGEELRIRRIGEAYYLTVKRGRGVEREEYESEIDGDLFDLLWPASEGARIYKTRYVVPLERDEETSTAGYPGHTIEVDQFGGQLSGLYLVEVEFSDADAAESFVPPNWFGSEVTDDERYSNGNLARVTSIP